MMGEYAGTPPSPIGLAAEMQRLVFERDAYRLTLRNISQAHPSAGAATLREWARHALKKVATPKEQA
jgi:hypothetical protein